MFKEEKFRWINKDNITINKGKDVLQPGHCTLSLLGWSKYKWSMIALRRIDSKKSLLGVVQGQAILISSNLSRSSKPTV